MRTVTLLSDLACGLSTYLPQKTRYDKEKSLESQDDGRPLVVCNLQPLSLVMLRDVISHGHIIRILHPAILVRILRPLSAELSWCPAIDWVTNVLSCKVARIELSYIKMESTDLEVSLDNIDGTTEAGEDNSVAVA